MRSHKNPFVGLVTVLLLLGLVMQFGCASHSSTNPVDRLAAQDRIVFTVGGAAVGAGIGAIIGNQNHHQAGAGAAIGAAVGGIAGYVAGDISAKRRKHFAKESDKLDHEIKWIQEAIDAQNKRQSELRTTETRLNTRIAEIDTAIAQNQNTQQARLATITELNNLIAQNQSVAADYTKSIEYVQKLIDKITSEGANAQKTRQQLQTQLAVLKDQYRDLSEANERLAAQRTKLQGGPS